jgi:hypothetical protein
MQRTRDKSRIIHTNSCEINKPSSVLSGQFTGVLAYVSEKGEFAVKICSCTKLTDFDNKLTFLKILFARKNEQFIQKHFSKKFRASVNFALHKRKKR